MISTTSSKMSPANKGQKRSISSITAPERLKTALKEKEKEIEQLMKDRQMERAEIAKAALQTDEAKSQLVNIKREFVAYKGQTQEELKTLKVNFSPFYLRNPANVALDKHF